MCRNHPTCTRSRNRFAPVRDKSAHISHLPLSADCLQARVEHASGVEHGFCVCDSSAAIWGLTFILGALFFSIAGRSMRW